MYIVDNQLFTKNYTKNTPFPMLSKFDFGSIFPKICEKSSLVPPPEGRKRGKNDSFRGVFSGKMQFYFTDYQLDSQKNEKK
jgi:hypothetical protein